MPSSRLHSLRVASIGLRRLGAKDFIYLMGCYTGKNAVQTIVTHFIIYDWPNVIDLQYHRLLLLLSPNSFIKILFMCNVRTKLTF